MSREKLESRIANLAEPFIASLDLELWGIELTMANKPMVRIFVDNEEGATIDECARISRHLGVALEVEDVMQSAYILEVSSPGLERPFFNAAQMSKYIGRQIELSLLDPNPEWPSRRKFRGVLLAVEGDVIVIEPRDKVEAPVAEKPKKEKGPKGKGPKAKAVAEAAPEAVAEVPQVNEEFPAEGECAEEKPVLRAHWDEVKKAHLIHVFPEPGHNKPR